MGRLNVFLIEDNEGDILLISEALKEITIPIDLSAVRDGHDAVEYLKNCCNGYLESLPDLIFLDINLPKMNGHEVLGFIKTTEELKSIPVIMLTTSSSNQDIRQAYLNYANCYITKPSGTNNYQEIIEKIEEFWFSLVQLPSNH
jgi:two-component system, chemotaxis family, response regulator Rcp1